MSGISELWLVSIGRLTLAGLLWLGLCPGVSAQVRMELVGVKSAGSLSSVRQAQPGRQNAVWALSLELQVRLTNEGPEDAELAAAEFFVDSGGILQRRRAPSGDGALELRTLSAGQSIEGKVEFLLLPWPEVSQGLMLKLGVEGQPEDDTPKLDAEGRIIAQFASEPLCTVDVLQWISQSSGLVTERLGPGGALALIRTQRNLDVLSAWVLRQQFEQLLGNGAERVVVTCGVGSRLSVSDEMGQWLAGLQQALQRNPQPAGALVPQMGNGPPPLPQLSRPLRYVAVAELEEVQSGNRAVQRRSLRMYPKLDAAIADGLAAVYRYAPLSEAIRDLQSETPGIRQGALAGAVDRLTEDEAAAVLERARSGSLQQQLEVAALLNQIPGRRAVTALQEMAIGENEELAQAALWGLTTSREDAAEKALSVVWEAGGTRPALRTQAAAAMVRSGDDRWTPFVAAWVRDFLELAVNGQTGGIQPFEFQGAVAFLLDRRHEPSQFLIRERLSQIAPAKFQDPVLRILLSQGQPLDLQAVREALNERIEQGEISVEVLQAAMILKDSRWTESLLADYRQLRNSGRPDDQRSLQPVLACALPAQIDQMVSQWEQFTYQGRSEFLVYLAAVDHVEWRKLAAGLLSEIGNSSETAINLLSQDASEESLALLRDVLRRQIAALEGTKDASSSGQTQLQVLTAQIASFVHPECRRLINQMCRDRNKYVRETAREQRGNLAQRSPALRLLVQEQQLREADSREEAEKVLEDVLRMDPFLLEARLRRSSVRMHAGNFDASMEDLRQAGEMSPENVEVESMIALVLVRQGQVKAGLEAAERLIASVPWDDYALYNGACSFARAAERAETTAEDRTRWIDRAIALIKATNDTGFDDYKHLGEDIDLQVLHDHPEWSALIEAARKNEGRER